MGGDYDLIYSTVNFSPDILSVQVTGLTANLPYRTYLVAHNFNEESDSSSVTTIYPCDLPSDFSKPSLVSVSQSDITISWTEPTNKGGCDITSYAVYIDDGNEGSFSEANADNDISVRNIPTLNSLQVTRNIGAPGVGKTFRLKVRVWNRAGSIDSDILGVVLSDTPSTPPNPSKIDAGSSSSQITLDISNFDSTYNGGSDVLSFNIQMDDGNGGNFQSMTGYTVPNLMPYYTANSLTRGLTYRFRYRAKNVNGWGSLSNVISILAADAPEAPPVPTLTSVSSTQIVLQLYPSTNNGGAVVSDYHLYRNTGTPGSALSEVTNYVFSTDGFSMTLVYTTEAMTQGKYYQFCATAENTIGESECSGIVTFPTSDIPTTPNAPRKIEASSSKTSIAVEWDQVADMDAGSGQITGYILYMDDGNLGSYSVVYNGAGKENVFTHIEQSLTTGLAYRFYVIAVNDAGESVASTVTTMHACVPPTGFAAPVQVAVTSSSVTLSWTDPSDFGGCSLQGFELYRDDG